MPRDEQPSLYSNTVGAWLWSRRRGVITGRAAAALHGARWVSEGAPIELLWNSYDPPRGIICRDERFTCDEVIELDDMAVASIQRTGFDLGRHLPRRTAVAYLDALARATGLRAEHIQPMIETYKGARGMKRLRAALNLMDPGSQSPRETQLRLLVIDAGFPRPQTQIPVLDASGAPFAYLDMGWEDVMIALEYDGDQHRTDRVQYVKDIHRWDRIQRETRWIVIRVVKEDNDATVLQRVREAWVRRQTVTRVV
jgi:hypothetical protein